MLLPASPPSHGPQRQSDQTGARQTCDAENPRAYSRRRWRFS